MDRLVHGTPDLSWSEIFQFFWSGPSGSGPWIPAAQYDSELIISSSK